VSLPKVVESFGFIDLHAHLREPGFEESETIATGSRAALRGGFTTICAMPNTEPTIDSPGLVAELIARAAASDGARVLPIAAITRGRRGKELADLVELAAAGAVAFSDDGAPVEDARLFRHALEYASARDLLVIEHAQDAALSTNGVMHEGAISARLGLSGIPAAAEEAAVARDIALARLVGARLHLTHLSTAGSVELVRRAKADGARITCDVTPHHLAMTDEWVAGSRAFAWDVPGSVARATPYDSSTKVNPPLRSLADVRALWRGLADGTVDAIATDHAPHHYDEKRVEFDRAPFGITGLETAVSLCFDRLVHRGLVPVARLVELLSINPARIMRVPGGSLAEGMPADMSILAPDLHVTVSAARMRSRSKNTPFDGWSLRGGVAALHALRP